MIDVLYTTENECYYPTFYFFSDEADELEKLRIELQTEGEAFSIHENGEWPKIVYKIVENYGDAYFNKYKYFQYRVFVDDGVALKHEDCLTLLDMLKHENLSLLFAKHSNMYVRAFAEGIIRGNIDINNFGKIDVVELKPEDNLEIE